MERAKLDVNGGITDIMQKMGENNPGAITLIRKIMDDPMGLFTLLTMNDMNIRGYQIWVAYKDYCRQDYDLFFKSINSRDKQMIRAVNIESARRADACREMKADYLHMPKAVQVGASYEDLTDLNLTKDDIIELRYEPKPIHPQAPVAENEWRQ